MREKWRLQNDWYFIREDCVNQIEEMGPNQFPDNWEKVTVPHTFRLEPYAHRGITTAQGVATYLKYFTLENELAKKSLYLTFEAVMGVSDVWLNGELLYTNYGGYLPFVVKLNQAAYFDGRENSLVVRADNRDDGQVPPGKPQALLDFTYFGGMYRDIWLEAVDDIFITDPIFEQMENQGGIILEYPMITKEKAILLVRTQVRSMKNQASNVFFEYDVVDNQGKSVVRKQKQNLVAADSLQEIVAEITIMDPQLWNLEHPNLYKIKVSLSVDGERIDCKETPFGIRKIEVDRTKGVLINGEVQLFLSGINRHQDYPVIGNAASAAMQKRDAILFKEAGFQVVRGAHYPMSEAFLDACDELGLLVFEATPGWQWYPTDTPEPFSSRVRENIQQMVRRDRNHPCILAYETVLNETYHVPRGFSRDSALVALAEQKDAKVSAESYGYDARAEANGIDTDAEFVYGFQDPLEKTEKAVMFLREYTDHYIEYYGDFNSRRVTRGNTDGFYPHGEARNLIKANQMLFRNLPEDYSLARCYKIRAENPAFTGAAIWTGIDSRGAGSLMSPCGIWDGYRLPKTSYWAYASQQDKNLILYIASDWTEKAPILDKSEKLICIGTDELREIYIYSNVDKVTLTVEKNGEVIWEKTETPYQKEEANYLPHPPFYFAEVPYESGSILRARGMDQSGKILIEETKETAGEPHHLNISVDTLGVPVQADGNDLVLVRAEIVDEKGVLCTNAEQKIFFTVEGDATIVGDGDLLAATNPAWAEAGIASVYVQAGYSVGKFEIKASGKDLIDGKGDIIFSPMLNTSFNGVVSSPTEKEQKGQSNLWSHVMTGDAQYFPTTIIEGEVYPESILLTDKTSWKLEGETYFYTDAYVKSGDEQAELLVYLDNVLRWRGHVGSLKMVVEGAKEISIELQSTMPTEILLLSPYLWQEMIDEEATELSRNIAFNKPTSATVNSEQSGAIWTGGAWFGKNPREGNQEWQVDLEETYQIRNIKILVGGQMGSDCTFYQYEIHTSKNGRDWTKQTENRRTSWSNGVLDLFTAQEVRYIKVKFVSVDGKLLAGIQKIEIYENYGVDSVNEYALSGILVQENPLVFEPNILEYRLPTQEVLTIKALAFDPDAKIEISGNMLSQTEEHNILYAQPVSIHRDDCGGNLEINVYAASGTGKRTYKIQF
ncbi:glycoside hydrolase family 2 TIM barrel-domain containing protein [Enterococcus alcedinis]|uniref:F5/8 type C domain-containing protein n=1 Tax=Enterococcus alcedinis TaxID=1274384 RepID=A0A917JGX3_9ENTE|nr:glycoside hydrolase family 2 TIM barrel-domain containing protein [Enterococcus alcedinis]MBP2102946.1 hypothetical protein [Enterococcus alcedinis]GGI66579.1 hypothetical protein GCM10011482_22330 [Enterococcus alcedinis]